MYFVSGRLPRVALTLSVLLGTASVAAHAGEVRYAGHGHAESPSWSLDGTHVAYEVNNFAGTVDMYVSQVQLAIAKDGKKVSLPGGSSAFGQGGSVVINPTWHPQGLVVFEGSNQGGNMRLYYVEPTSSAASEMVKTSEIPGDLTFPSISADGSTMAFIADATGNGDIRTRDTSTAKIGQLTNSDYSEMFPQYSSDGKSVVFSRKRNNTEDIFVMPAIGGEAELAVGGGGDQTRPQYVAGGGIVYFDNGRGQDLWDLAIVSGPGGDKRTIGKGVRLPTRARPSVSPDGQWVAYAHSDTKMSSKVMLSRVDGSKTVEVPTKFEACGDPAIGVQGKRVLLAYTALPTAGADWRFLYVEDITDLL
ncbi:MAG: Tol biopolymer transport system component [Myxococcota bacterium]|jgi:Tol biopolymer transport system component